MLEPARMSTGLHAYPHCHADLTEFAVELPGRFLVSEACFAEFARVGVYVRNLLEARVIITTYDDHVRLLSPEPFLVGFSTTNFTRVWEPTLLWNHFTHPMREDVKQKHFSILSVRPRSLLASRPLFFVERILVSSARSATEYDRDTDRSCWSSLTGFMQRFRHHWLRSCASQPLA